MKKILLPLLLSAALLAEAVHAHCPLCTAAVGGIAVTANYYGFDASVIGVFIGAFAVSTGLWVSIAIKRKFIKFQAPLIVISSFLLTAIPLLALMPGSFYFPVLVAGESGSILNRVYWPSRMLVGSIIGGMAALAAYFLHNKVKEIRGRVLFPYQGVIFTLGAILAASLSLYALVR